MTTTLWLERQDRSAFKHSWWCMCVLQGPCNWTQSGAKHSVCVSRRRPEPTLPLTAATPALNTKAAECGALDAAAHSAPIQQTRTHTRTLAAPTQPKGITPPHQVATCRSLWGIVCYWMSYVMYTKKQMCRIPNKACAATVCEGTDPSYSWTNSSWLEDKSWFDKALFVTWYNHILCETGMHFCLKLHTENQASFVIDYRCYCMNHSLNLQKNKYTFF